MRYDSVGMPDHLKEFSKGVRRELPKSRGSRDIDQRLTIKTIVKKSSSLDVPKESAAKNGWYSPKIT